MAAFFECREGRGGAPIACGARTGLVLASFAAHAAACSIGSRYLPSPPAGAAAARTVRARCCSCGRGCLLRCAVRGSSARSCATRSAAPVAGDAPIAQTLQLVAYTAWRASRPRRVSEWEERRAAWRAEEEEAEADAPAAAADGGGRSGARSPLPDLYGLESGEQLWAPHTQPESPQIGLASSHSANADVASIASRLKSNMMAFKAANPGCVISDFVRWYAPSEWVCAAEEEEEEDDDKEEEAEDRLVTKRRGAAASKAIYERAIQRSERLVACALGRDTAACGRKAAAALRRGPRGNGGARPSRVPPSTRSNARPFSSHCGGEPNRPRRLAVGASIAKRAGYAQKPR